jgi:hypothetical protein
MTRKNILAIVFAATVTLLAGGSARAWDAGPLTCKRNNCTGGALPVGSGVPDTQPKYADSVLPSSTGRYADCPAGYTNNGATCGRSMDSFPLASRPADCPSGYTNNGATCGRSFDSYSAPSRVADCPAGFTNYGLFCASDTVTYTKGCTTVFKDYPCAPGFTDYGCTCTRWGTTVGTSSMSCPTGYFLNQSLGRCYVSCPAGYTNMGESCYRPDSTLLMDSMTCQPDEFKSGARCYKYCPAGYTNMGESCYRPDSTLLMDSMTCQPGEFKSGARCYPTNVCPTGRQFWGGLCYASCPAGSVRTAVSTCVHQIRWRGNTHRFIVDRALDAIKNAQRDAITEKVVDSMIRSNECDRAWQDGLWDADDDLADTGFPPYGGSHFYNGAGRDAFGDPTTVVTYTIAGLEQLYFGNARTNAASRINTAFFEAPNVRRSSPDCYQLGLALHYMTDVTQPMHSTGFHGLSIPFMLHPVLEEYVPTIQGRVLKRPWQRRWANLSHDEIFHQTAVRTAGMAPALMEKLEYNGAICTMTPEDGITYTGSCFVNDPAVNAQLDAILSDAIESTASYIYSVFKLAP